MKKLILLLGFISLGSCDIQPEFYDKDGKGYYTTWNCVEQEMVPVWKTDYAYDHIYKRYSLYTFKDIDYRCTKYVKDTIQIQPRK